jgi:hypothetical protein
VRNKASCFDIIYFLGELPMYFEGELPVMNYGNCNNGNNGWNDWSWIIGLALVGGLFGGWGNGGFGFGGGRGYGASPATQADLSAGFANSEIMSDLNDILLGQATMQNFINQGFSGLNATVTNGFAGVNNAVCTLGYQNQAGFNALSTQLAQCCCDTRAAIADVKYSNERNTCDIIRAGQDNTRAILDYLTGEKIASLQAENSGLKAQISNDRQSAYLLNELKPCPIPAYITCNPNAPYGLGYGVGYGYGTFNGGCCGASVQ